ncbi:MAG: hypothetical protein WBZ36_24475 [Candidatus Nitrosopolaris sp.]
MNIPGSDYCFYLPVKIKVKNREVYRVKVSQLCKMIEDSIHGGKYPLQNERNPYSNLLQVINRSDSDDLKSSEIKIEVRMRGLYIISNYVPNIQHLPGIIEGDVLDYFKILCRRLERMNDDTMQSPTMHRSK